MISSNANKSPSHSTNDIENRMGSLNVNDMMPPISTISSNEIHYSNLNMNTRGDLPSSLLIDCYFAIINNIIFLSISQFVFYELRRSASQSRCTRIRSSWLPNVAQSVVVLVQQRPTINSKQQPLNVQWKHEPGHSVKYTRWGK